MTEIITIITKIMKTFLYLFLIFKGLQPLLPAKIDVKGANKSKEVQKSVFKRLQPIFPTKIDVKSAKKCQKVQTILSVIVFIFVKGLQQLFPAEIDANSAKKSKRS